MPLHGAGHLRGVLGAFVVATVFALTGCASDIMKNYIGQPIELIVLDYGPPTTVVDLSQGERAYQWRKISTNVVAGSSSGEVRHTKHGTEYQTTETPRVRGTSGVFLHLLCPSIRRPLVRDQFSPTEA